MLGTKTVQVRRYNPAKKKYEKISGISYNIEQAGTLPGYRTLLHDAIDAFRIKQGRHNPTKLPKIKKQHQIFQSYFKKRREIEKSYIRQLEKPVMDGLQKYDIVLEEFKNNTGFTTYLYEGCGILTNISALCVGVSDEVLYHGLISGEVAYKTKLPGFVELSQEISSKYNELLSQLDIYVNNPENKGLAEKVTVLYVHPAFADGMSRSQLAKYYKAGIAPQRLNDLIRICSELNLQLEVSDNTKEFSSKQNHEPYLYLFKGRSNKLYTGEKPSCNRQGQIIPSLYTYFDNHYFS